MSDTATLTLADFLLARIADDEQWFQRATVTGGAEGEAGRFVRRVLADCDAKRRIVEIHTGNHECASLEDSCVWIADSAVCETIRTLAAVYAAHPEYRDEWRPTP